MNCGKFVQIIIYSIILTNIQQAFADSSDTFLLSDKCPPSFEQLENGICKLVTLYDSYSSRQGKGVGGLKTALPKARDGFTAKQIDLGRYLFFDPILSGNGRLSCGSCHDPAQGLSDGLARSIGVLGTPVSRSSPTLWNVAFLNTFFWDARSNSLEQQVEGPLYSPDEMGNTPEQLLHSLNNSRYQRLFREAFGENTPHINLKKIYTAIVAFESSLISLNSRYDQYAHGYHQALNEREVKGLNVFRSFVARCSQCHTPPLFTNQQIAVIGTPEPQGLPLDIGAEKTYSEPRLKGAFKVPTLRNIAKTAPYMHSGKFKNLKSAIKFYTKGRGHAIPEGIDMQLHWHIWEPNLSDDELNLLVDFLHTLTDETFVPVIPVSVPSGLTPVTHN